MGVSMSTLGGWAVVLSCFGFYGYREWMKRQRAQLSKTSVAKTKQHIVPKKEAKEPKPRRQRIEDTSSKLPSQPTPQTFAGSYSTDDDADTDNREFARQLLNAKQGTKFTGKVKDETRQKSVKQSRAQEMPTAADSAKISAPSSTAGIDADDDQSPAASPIVASAQVSGDVSDMLEKVAPGPSVMRLTNTEEKKPKEKKAKAPEHVETKKQRQNKKKAEAAKAAREEDEKDRKVKLEAQRRLAREAEGRAAKDGSAFMAAQAAGKNAWNGNGVSNKTNGGLSTNGFVQPLDTVDSNAVYTDSSKAGEWMSSLPSEEEQMELVKKVQEEEAWSTVKTKVRKPRKVETAVEDRDDVPAVAPAAAAPVAAPLPKKQENQRPVKPFTQKSSFAALSTDSPAEQEEQEEEWDV